MKEENVYIDILTEYLKDNFSLDCIDLNKLFIEGRVGSVYIDWREVHNRAVDIRRLAGVKRAERLNKSPTGRAKLLKMMTPEQKIKKLEEEGIQVTKADMNHLDELLQDWVEDQ